MALFSFRHSVKTFSSKCESATRVAASGQTAAHLRYITRPKAARDIIRTRIDHPSDAILGAAAERSAEKRKGRVCERFIIALPVEATDAQRSDLARRFADSLTQGKAGYVLAVHDKDGNDKLNPHFHLVAFDVHERTSGRGRPRSVIGMARKKAIETWAKNWADIHNEMMCSWGYTADSNITHESFASQGIDRIPEIHEGAGARHLTHHNKNLKTKPQWKNIDAGQSRADANILIQEINQLKEQEEHEAGIRLGNGNAGDTHQSNGSGETFGEDRRRRVPGFVADFGAKQAAFGSDESFERDRCPPWSLGGIPEGLQPPFAGTGGENTARPVSDPPVGPGRGPRRLYSVRRVFLELMMLRDSIKARLLHKTAATVTSAGVEGLGKVVAPVNRAQRSRRAIRDGNAR